MVRAQVTDDVLQLAGPASDAPEIVRSDHLELWVSFGDPPFPPLGYASTQRGLTELPDDAACGALDEATEECVEWRRAQMKLRRALTEGFRSQLLLSRRGVQRVIAGKAQQPVGEVRIEESDGGWSLEAEIPWSALPLTPAEPVTRAQVLVELVDNDAGRSTQESMLSNRKDRKTDQPATWQTVELEPHDGARHRSGIAEHLLGSGGWFRPADPNTAELHQFVNRPVGYQWLPHAPSPEEVVYRLPAEPAAEEGPLAVWVARADTDALVFVSRAGAAVGSADLRCHDAVRVVPEGGGFVVVGGCASVRGEFALGPGSAYPIHIVHAHRVGADGTLTKVFQKWVEGDEASPELSLGWHENRVHAVRIRDGETFDLVEEGSKAKLTWKPM